MTIRAMGSFFDAVASLAQTDAAMPPAINAMRTYFVRTTTCQNDRSSQSAKEAAPSPGGEGWGEGEPFSDFSAMAVPSRSTHAKMRQVFLIFIFVISFTLLGSIVFRHQLFDPNTRIVSL